MCANGKNEAATLFGSNFVKTTSEDWDMNTIEAYQTATLVADFEDHLFDGNGPVPLVISRRDPVTAPLRHAAREKKARIQQNPTLSESQRRNALEMLCQQTEAEMRRALGDRNFHAFKTFNQWWFRELSGGN